MDYATLLSWGVTLTGPLWWLLNIPGLALVKDCVLMIVHVARNPSSRPLFRNALLLLASVTFIIGSVRLVHESSREQKRSEVQSLLHCRLAIECGSLNPQVKQRHEDYGMPTNQMSKLMRADSQIDQRCAEFETNCLTSPMLETAAKIFTFDMVYANPTLIVALISGLIGLSMISWTFVYDIVRTVKQWTSRTIGNFVAGQRHKSLTEQIAKGRVAPLKQE